MFNQISLIINNINIAYKAKNKIPIFFINTWLLLLLGNLGLNNEIEPSSTLCVINKNNNDTGIQFEEQGFKNFKKPIPLHINHFFSVHPIQPLDNATFLPFDYKKVFFKYNNMNRIWFTYDVQENKLYCSVCLAFTT